MDRTVQCGGTRLVYAVHQTLPSLAEVGLACETSNKGPRKLAKTVGKTAVVKAGAYIVSIDKKTTVYKLEPCEIAFFENACFSCP